MTSANVQDKMSNVQGQVANAVETAREAAHSVTSRVTDFFQGNPFESPVGKKIELATDATKLATENWGLNMEICDFINNSIEGGRDAMRAIRKRLQTQMGKNNAIVMYTLTLLETCVKNCDQRFKALACQKEFISELVKLVGAKFDAPQVIQERVLSLIQSWADAFRGHTALSGVVEVYDELKSKGVEFPAMDFDSMAPIITPRRTVFTNVETSTAQDQPPQEQQQSSIPSSRQAVENYSIMEPSHGPVAASPEQLAKLRSELDVANVNLTVLRELLGSLTPNREEHADFELLQQLFVSCQEMQRRVVQLIPMVINEEVTYELLTINDEFNTIFNKYNRYMSNRSSQSGPSTAPTPGDLIDFGSSSNGNNSSSNFSDKFGSMNIQAEKVPVTTSSPTSSSTTPSAKNNEAYVHDQTEAGLRTAAFNKTEPISEREAQEIAGWLGASEDAKSAKDSKEKNDDGL